MDVGQCRCLDGAALKASLGEKNASVCAHIGQYLPERQHVQLGDFS